MSLAETEDNSPPPSPEEIYQAFRRSLQRRKGFGILFVECSPAQGERLIKRIEKDLPQKAIEVLKFEQPVPNGNFYQQVEEFLGQKPEVNILFIQGLEYSLYDYEETRRHLGWSSQDIYSYSWKGVPPVLINLNQQRERFRDNFNTCFVFLVPSFVIKYFIHRAPDFFDWRSGLFQFPMDSEQLKQESWKIYFNAFRLEAYSALTPQESRAKILEVQALIDEAYQNDEEKVNLLCEQALLLQLLNKYEEAVICYNKAIKVKPDKPDVWYNRGNALSALARKQEALDSYDKALNLKPDFYEAWHNRGGALNSLGRYLEAIESYNKALKIKPDDSQAWIGKGNALNSLKHYEKAVESYEEALKIEPDNYKIWNNLGTALSGLGQHKEAINRYDHAIQLNPESSTIWHSRSGTLYQLGDYAKALADCDRAIQLDSDDSKIWVLRGVILAALGQYEEADNSYSHAYHRNCWDFLGNALCNFGCYDEAVRIYNYALQVEPDDDTIWYFRGLALYKLKHYEEAIKSFDKSLEFSPRSFQELYIKSCCYALQGNVNETIKSLQLLPPDYRVSVKTDAAFDAIRLDDRFQSLISGGE